LHFAQRVRESREIRWLKTQILDEIFEISGWMYQAVFQLKAVLTAA
jgi:hypothetical protein